MTDIDSEAKRMADTYRALCKEFSIASHMPDSESLRTMTLTIFINGTRGTAGSGIGSATRKAVQVTEPSGIPAAADTKPAAPKPDGPTEKQVAWLKSHGWKEEDIKAMSTKEAYWAINKAMKGR